MTVPFTGKSGTVQAIKRPTRVIPRSFRVLRTNEPIEMPELRRGSKGDLVRRVQAVLKEACYSVA